VGSKRIVQLGILRVNGQVEFEYKIVFGKVKNICGIKK